MKKPDDPCRFWHAKMKVGLPAYMPTADELTSSQTYGHENGEAIFIRKHLLLCSIQNQFKGLLVKRRVKIGLNS